MPVPDFTGQYNTALSPAEEYDYGRWLQLQSLLNKRDMGLDNIDYDMRGAYKAGAGQSDNDHWTDQFKKPNHPSFSDQSVYHGVDNHTGGSWQQMGGRWYFTPGASNLRFRTPEELTAYFQRADPTVSLMLPGGAANMTDYVQQRLKGE